MTEREARIVRRIAAGAALIAIPVAGMQLYYKHDAVLAAPRSVTEDSIDQTLARLRRVDPAMIGYREIGKINAGLATPLAICVVGVPLETHSDMVLGASERSAPPATRSAQKSVAPGSVTLLVAANNLVRLVRDGSMREIALRGSPTCLAADEAAIFVGFRDHLEIYDFDGTRKATWPALPAGALLTGIAVGASEVYLADSGRRVIVHADRHGNVLNEIGRANPGSGTGGLLLPSPHLGVAIASDGTIWTNNTGRHRMENYAPNGTLERFWGMYGVNDESFVGCCNPTEFAILADGSFITAEKGVARVKHYLPDGRFDCFVAAPAAFAENITGIGVVAASDGRIYVLDRSTSLVHVFERAKGGAS